MAACEPKELREPLAGLGGREFTAKPPEEFMRMTAGMPDMSASSLKMTRSNNKQQEQSEEWEPGIPEASAVPRWRI